MSQVQLPFKEILPGKFLNLDKVILFEVVKLEYQKEESWMLSIQVIGVDPKERLMFSFKREQDAYRAMGINRSNLAMFS